MSKNVDQLFLCNIIVPMDKRFRKATLSDIDDVMAIIEDGRAFLKPQNGGQWQDGYPNRDSLLNDIKNENLYVILTSDNQIASVAAFTYYEKDYDTLYEGAWLSDYPYMVMHRIAVKNEYRGQGYGKALFELFIEVGKEKGYRSLRVDTHEDNKPMLSLLDKYDFEACGKAILTPNKDRIVLEKLL